MGPTSSQIEQEIRLERSELGDNIKELNERVRTAFNWRHRIDQRPLAILGASIAGGVLLGMARARSSPPRSAYRPPEPRARRLAPTTQYQKSQAWDTWEKVKAALIGVGTQRVKDFLDQTIPGFRREYERTEPGSAMGVGQEADRGRPVRRIGSPSAIG